MPKIYLSPAYHKANNCSVNGCYETTHNNEYMDALEPFLKACGIDFKRGPRRVPMSNEDGTALMKQAVAESNAYGADIHYVSHTNASGNVAGDGKIRGCRPIIYKGSARGEKLAESMVKYRREVYPCGVQLNRRTDLYELSVPNGVSFYEEHVFHDNREDALWFHENLTAVARSAAKGFCEYFGIPFVEPGGAEATRTDTKSQAASENRVTITFSDSAKAQEFLGALKNAVIE